MATIGKITLASSGTSALSYAEGKNKLGPETKAWLKENGVSPAVVDTLVDRAVVKSGINVQPDYAAQQMRAVRNGFSTHGKEVVRVIQSFPVTDLSAANPKDWQTANELGLELAEKAFPNRQVAVYTHLDGAGHKLHNHIVVNMPDLTTGRKYSEHRDWEKISQLNDQITQARGLSIPQRTQGERHSMAERQLAEKAAYVWKDDLRQRIDKAMSNASIFDFKAFSASLEHSGVIVRDRGQSLSYAFLDANNKQRRARGSRLGADYEKEAIADELARRTREQQRIAEQQDQTRLAELDRQAEQRKQQAESREQQTEQRESRLTATAPNLAHLANTSGQLERQAHAFRDRIKSAVEPITAGLQRFRDALPALTDQVKQVLATSTLYQDVANRFQADMAKKETERQNAIKRDLAGRSTPTPPRPVKDREPDRGGLEL